MFILLLFVIADSNNKNKINISNINTVKSIKSSQVTITDISTSVANSFIPEYKEVFSTNEIKNNLNSKIEFTGTLTGYGPDCVGCSGILGCPPHQNVKKGNIYYNDAEYGIIRILAADPSIPCGSIIKISNYLKDSFYGIVLDRGSDIHGLTMDLLYESESQTSAIGRKYNINFKIDRWGF